MAKSNLLNMDSKFQSSPRLWRMVKLEYDVREIPFLLTGKSGMTIRHKFQVKPEYDIRSKIPNNLLAVNRKFFTQSHCLFADG